MNNKIKIMAGLVCALALTSCGKSEREETLQKAREAISSHQGYNKEERNLLIYENDENDLGLTTIHLADLVDPTDSLHICIQTHIDFNSKYNKYIDEADMDIVLYAKTDPKKNNMCFSMSFIDFDLERGEYVIPFSYYTSGKVGEEYVKGTDKYQIVDESYRNENNCPLTKEDCRYLFNLVLVLSFETTKDFFFQNDLVFYYLYPNYTNY